MRSRRWYGIPIMIITALPVLLLSPFPTQDGPSHLYGAHVLRHLHDIHYPAINRAFEYSPSALSTWTVHGTLSILLGMAPPFWAEKVIVLSFVAWLFCLFMFGRDNEETLFFPLCALPLFVMSFVLRMGFYSFCLSVPLAVQAVSVWTDDGVEIGKRRHMLAGGLLVLLPLFHLLTAGWALALMGAGSIGAVLTRRGASMRELGTLALASIPFLAVAAWYPSSSTPYAWEGIAPRVAALVAGGAFVNEGRSALWWSTVPSVGLLALGVLFLRDEVRGAVNGNRVALRRALAVVGALFLALLVPEEGAGGAYIGVRCNLLFFLLLLFFFRTWRLPARVDAVLSLVFLVLSLIHVSRTYTMLKPASAAERDIVKSATLLHDHTTALVVVAGEWMDAAAPTLASQIRPLLHAGDLLGVGADRTILTFYEGELTLFPVSFKRAANPFGVLFDRNLFGWDAPDLKWDAVPTWQGGVDYVGVWDEKYLLAAPSGGGRFRDAMCGYYDEVYRSDSWPWAIYQLRRGQEGGNRTPWFCGRVG